MKFLAWRGWPCGPGLVVTSVLLFLVQCLHEPFQFQRLGLKTLDWGACSGTDKCPQALESGKYHE